MSSVKRGSFKKLSLALESKMTQDAFNEVFIFLDGRGHLDKVIPYKLFEDKFYYSLPTNISQEIFKKWLYHHTKNIEKPFNKGRKVSRVLKDFHEKYGSELAYTMVSDKVFYTMLRVFIMDESEFLTQLYPTSLMVNLFLVREYLTCIFGLELLSYDDKKFDKLVYLLLIKDIDCVMEEVKIAFTSDFSDYLQVGWWVHD